MKPTPQTYIPLPFQNPKLLIPSGPAKMVAGSFLLYPPASGKGNLFKIAAITAARLGLFSLIPHWEVKDLAGFPCDSAIGPILSPASFAALEEVWQQFFNLDRIFFALSLGTPDHYRKVTALVFDAAGEIQGLAKIGATQQAKKLIRHEFRTLQFLRRLTLPWGIAPAPLAFGETEKATWLLQSALADGRVSSLKLKPFHLAFLADLSSQTRKDGMLRDIHFWKNLLEGIAEKTTAASLSLHIAEDPAFIKNLFRECHEVMEKAADVTWPLTAVHGDFAPWNIRVIGGRAAVYDWENFLPLAPAGWDVIHYEVRVQNLVKKRSLAELFAEFSKTSEQNDSLTAWEMKTGIKIPNRRLLALLLFADLCCGASLKAIAEGKVPLDLSPAAG